MRDSECCQDLSGAGFESGDLHFLVPLQVEFGHSYGFDRRESVAGRKGDAFFAQAVWKASQKELRLSCDEDVGADAGHLSGGSSAPLDDILEVAEPGPVNATTPGAPLSGLRSRKAARQGSDVYACGMVSLLTACLL